MEFLNTVLDNLLTPGGATFLVAALSAFLLANPDVSARILDRMNGSRSAGSSRKPAPSAQAPSWLLDRHRALLALVIVMAIFGIAIAAAFLVESVKA